MYWSLVGMLESHTPIRLADTYQEPHWYTGEMKTRCSECHKVVVAYDAETARLRAQQITERPKVHPKYNYQMKAYKGGCGHWHVSRGKKL
jgi:hypothetical protein